VCQEFWAYGEVFNRVARQGHFPERDEVRTLRVGDVDGRRNLLRIEAKISQSGICLRERDPQVRHTH
jgi:hypothetical protein